MELVFRILFYTVHFSESIELSGLISKWNGNTEGLRVCVCVLSCRQHSVSHACW